MDWIDTTSYSQHDKVRKQNVWTLKTSHATISVVRNHRLNPGFWVMHCQHLAIDTFDLGLPNDVPPEKAQRAAIDTAKYLAEKIYKSLENL